MYDELLNYIKSDQDNVRSEAAHIFLSLTAAPLEPALEAMIDQYLTILWRLACRPTYAGSKDALSALVNLAETYASKLSSDKWIGSICEEIEERRVVGPVEYEQLLFMFLANVTRESDAVDALLSRDIFLWRILQHFAVSGDPSSHSGAREAGNYICNIFVNVSGFSHGRDWFRQFTCADWDILGDQCRWAERRPLALSVVKNVVCDLNLIEELAEKENNPNNVERILILLSRLIYPSPKAIKDNYHDLHKSYEIPACITALATGPLTDIESRKLVIECVVSLLRLKKVREIARCLDLYSVLQVWHTIDDSTDIMEAIEEVIHLVHYSEEELAEHDRQAGVTPPSPDA